MHNEHNENCCYKDKNVLYALFEVMEGKHILISAKEVSVFDDYLRLAQDNDNDISIDLDTCDKEPFQLVYGALMFHEIETEKVIEDVNGLKGYAMIDLDGNEIGKISASAYHDICMYQDK